MEELAFSHSEYIFSFALTVMQTSRSLNARTSLQKKTIKTN